MFSFVTSYREIHLWKHCTLMEHEGTVQKLSCWQVRFFPIWKCRIFMTMYLLHCSTVIFFSLKTKLRYYKLDCVYFCLYLIIAHKQTGNEKKLKLEEEDFITGWLCSSDSTKFLHSFLWNLRISALSFAKLSWGMLSLFSKVLCFYCSLLHYIKGDKMIRTYMKPKPLNMYTSDILKEGNCMLTSIFEISIHNKINVNLFSILYSVTEFYPLELNIFFKFTLRN